MLLAQTHVWHYWVAMVLAISAILLAASVAVGYLRSVVKPRFPSPRD